MGLLLPLKLWLYAHAAHPLVYAAHFCSHGVCRGADLSRDMVPVSLSRLAQCAAPGRDEQPRQESARIASIAGYSRRIWMAGAGK